MPTGGRVWVHGGGAKKEPFLSPVQDHAGILLKDNQQQVIGGREFPISDQGGGAVMGLHLIQQVLLSVDDIVPHTPLVQHVMSHFGHDVDAIVSWSKTARPCDYGQFSPAIFSHAAEGDSLAIALLNQTAADVEMLLSALIKRGGAEQICLMGSIGEHIQPWLVPPLKARLALPQGGMPWTGQLRWQKVVITFTHFKGPP